MYLARKVEKAAFRNVDIGRLPPVRPHVSTEIRDGDTLAK
jgi:hypothetical protein